MKTLLAFCALIACGSAQAEIYKCTVDGKITYTEVPCKAGTGAKANIAYSTPTPEQVEAYRTDLQRRSDAADARTQYALARSAEQSRVRQAERNEYLYQKDRADRLKRLDDIQKKLDDLAKAPPPSNIVSPLPRYPYRPR